MDRPSDQRRRPPPLATQPNAYCCPLFQPNWFDKQMAETTACHFCHTVTTDGQLRCESLGKFGTGVGRSAAGRLFGRKICPGSKDAAVTVQLDHQFVVGNIFIPHV
ncbi:hypothetical protein T02_11722 [Trichinella nativa]|uniref:Uncharacterized protein n=1 Tax=Trichinella nativa TaxID=6335 RepID=A0A0V1L716_9BILA|nr:hypothetical protein T06_1358 [Trichinella sp. T6]KRZ55320.1 hypothetical protein T02_11722 [Trichinella nativa]